MVIPVLVREDFKSKSNKLLNFWNVSLCVYIWSSGCILWCDQLSFLSPALASLSVRLHCLIEQHGSFSWRTQLWPQKAASVQLQHLLQGGTTKCSQHNVLVLLDVAKMILDIYVEGPHSKHITYVSTSCYILHIPPNAAAKTRKLWSYY